MTKRKSGVPLNSSPMIDEFILNYIKQNDITQEQLAERLGIKQSKISEIKNNANRHFDIEDICNFAIEYNQSIDEMADIYNRSESVPKREKTFKDVLSRLFYIESSNSCISSIQNMEKGGRVKVSFEFISDEMNDILKQWKVSRQLSVEDKSGQSIQDIIKSSLLKESSALKEKYQYQSEREYIRKLYESAEKTLISYGLYSDDDEYNICIPDDDELIRFEFTKEDYLMLREYYPNRFVIEEIDALIHENKAVFPSDVIVLYADLIQE